MHTWLKGFFPCLYIKVRDTLVLRFCAVSPEGFGGLVSLNEIKALKADDDSFVRDKNIDVPIVILTGDNEISAGHKT